eukprot:scaffold608449_cov27-Prasinocladus_malaysianus.AAC.1
MVHGKSRPVNSVTIWESQDFTALIQQLTVAVDRCRWRWRLRGFLWYGQGLNLLCYQCTTFAFRVCSAIKLMAFRKIADCGGTGTRPPPPPGAKAEDGTRTTTYDSDYENRT